jgi:hypothetical protein
MYVPRNLLFTKTLVFLRLVSYCLAPTVEVAAILDAEVWQMHLLRELTLEALTDCSVLLAEPIPWVR